MQIALARRALLNDSACGDQGDFWEHGEDVLLCLVDGLGHGIHAQTAALAALAYVSAHLDQALPELFAGCDAALRGTRGAAMEVLRIHQNGVVAYAGIGNTQAMIWSPQQKIQRLAGNYGIVGGGYRKLIPIYTQIGANDLLILHTDGISEKLQLNAYQEDFFDAPSLLANRILMDWGKTLDDAAVMVYRHPASR